MLTGLTVMATNFAVKNYLSLNLGHNATIIIELSIGLASAWPLGPSDGPTTNYKERHNCPPRRRNASGFPAGP